MNLSYLLVKPNNYVKEQFQTILSQSVEDLNVFIFDNDDTDIGWMLSIAQQVDCVIVDVDNCDPITQSFVTLMLTAPNAHYITSDEQTPYNLISRNRIYDLEWIVEKIKEQEQEEGNDDDIQEE